TSITITDNTTVGQLFNAIKPYGLTGKILTAADGSTSIEISGINTQIADGTSNIVSGLGLTEIRQGDFDGNIIYWDDDADSGLITEDMLLSDFDKDGYISQGSLIFNTGTGDDAVQHIINITANETVGSLLKKFNDQGIDAVLDNGVIKISSGLDGIEFTGGTSGLVKTIGIDIDNIDVYASSDSMLTYNGDVSYSAANFADANTKLEIVNATDGTMSIFVDGIKCNITINKNDTFSDLFRQISSTVAAKTGQTINIGFLDKSGNIVTNPTAANNTGIIAMSIAEGHELVVGASNDTSNFATIANLNKTDFNKITGSRALYKVNVNTLITESGLYRDGDITEGTFTIGDAEFTIDSTTTLASLLEQINKSEKAYATAYWDTLSGTMVIQSTLTGASLINIEAGTSNFTDIMGFTTQKDGKSALVTDSQELGNNAIVRINGTTVVASSNTITSEISKIKGLTINLKNVSEGETVTITVEQDREGIYNAVSETLDAYNAMMEALN
ncbi:MAG: flagellar filament capping protein FliD, partial [Candidatus Gastranaerophilaceae bacterium]